MGGDHRYLLGVDLGTTACKAVVFDSEGRPQGRAEAEVEIAHPRPTWAVGDPEGWWRMAAEVIREAVSQSAVRPSQIAAVGPCGLMHAPVLLDEDGAVIEEAPLWMDQRCRPECEWLAAEHRALFDRIAGHAPATSASAAKLLWFAMHKPEAIRRARRFMLPKDYLRYRLCGDWATDPGDASGTGLMDRAAKQWSRELVEVVGFRMEAMPPIVPSSQVRGEVSEAAADECGLAPGTAVVCGSSDMACTVQGSNARRAGQTTLYLGTAAWLCQGEGEGQLRFLGFAATSAACLRWWRQTLGEDSLGYEDLLQQVEGSDPGAEGLLFFPHLMGERGPVVNPRAKGGFLGLTLAHRGPDLLRAILEGVGYHLRQMMEVAGAKEGDLVAAGGGARSPQWLQIIADITGRRVRRCEVTEAAALGAAILAGVGIGMFATPEEASARLVRLTDAMEPRQASAAGYHRFYQVWREADAWLQQFCGQFPEEV